MGRGLMASGRSYRSRFLVILRDLTGAVRSGLAQIDGRLLRFALEDGPFAASRFPSPIEDAAQYLYSAIMSERAA